MLPTLPFIGSSCESKISIDHYLSRWGCPRPEDPLPGIEADLPEDKLGQHDMPAFPLCCPGLREDRFITAEAKCCEISPGSRVRQMPAVLQSTWVGNQARFD